MRLTEQAKILKEEIRRLERNQQREKEAANMEYLKNILLKVSSHYIAEILTNRLMFWWRYVEKKSTKRKRTANMEYLKIQTYWQVASYRRNFEVFSVNFTNQWIDHDKISHEKS